MAEILSSQVIELLQQNDRESVKYIISDEPSQVIQSLCSLLPQKEAVIVKRIYLQVKGQTKGVILQDQFQLTTRNKKIDKFLEEGDANEDKKSESFLQLINKPNQKLRYMEEYGYPFYDLFKRMIITHGDLHPSMATIKTLHSQIQIMYSILFGKQILQLIFERYNGWEAGLKSYLQFVFPSQSQKYREAQTLYRNLKKSTKQQQSSDQQDYQTCQELPLSEDQTLLLDQKQFLATLAQSIPFEQFQQFCRNRQYNFMCFGIKKLEQYIGIPTNVIEKIKEREFCELVSFLTVRFVRKILFIIIRQRGLGKLTPLLKCITSTEITAIGNEVLDKISNKIEDFNSPVKSNEQEATSLFLSQFQLMNYHDFVPKIYINEAKNKQVPVAEYVWQQNKEYKALWIQRVKAEKMVKEGDKSQRSNIQYYNHIKQNFTAFQNSSATFWKDYIMKKFGYQKELKSTPSKKLKLESLKD